jgi:hypothetical protein
MWPGDRSIDSLCDWIRNSKSPQQAGARYRVARGKNYVDTDWDYSQLFDAYNQFLTEYREENHA